MINMLKAFFLLFTIITLTGCLEREIYTEIVDKTIISHPPETLQIEDPSTLLKSTFKTDPASAMKMSVYIHCAKCTNAQSKSLGSDFDGYIRITLSKSDRTLARAQMDYKGEATPDEVQQVYDRLMRQLQW
jgi:hypothetical protein